MRLLPLLLVLLFSPWAWSQSSCRGIFSVKDPLFGHLTARVLEVDEPLSPLVAQSQLKAMNEQSLDLARQIDYKADTSKISTLLYVASGYDAATPFLLIPHLKRVIAIDEHPFALPQTSKITPKLPEDDSYSYTTITHVNEQNRMGEAILGRLLEAFPEARFQSVELIPEGVYVHGRVLFDLGEGTPIREYIHIQAIVPGQHRNIDLIGKPPFRWNGPLETMGYQALLAKASMYVYQKNPVALEAFMLPLIKNKGLFLDMDGLRLENSFELYQLMGNQPPSFHRADLKIDSWYGYSRNDSLTKISPHLTQFE